MFLEFRNVDAHFCVSKRVKYLVGDGKQKGSIFTVIYIPHIIVTNVYASLLSNGSCTHVYVLVCVLLCLSKSMYIYVRLAVKARVIVEMGKAMN